MTTHCTTRKSAAWKAVSVLCLALFIFLQALAAVPSLHRHFHHDANQADHHCAVTLLSQGHVDVPVTGTVAIISPVSFVYTVTAPDVFVPVAADRQSPPGRAPPASLLG